MEPLLVHPDPPPPELAQALDLGGYPWKGVAAEADIAGAEPDDGWSGAIVLVDRDPDTAFAVCRALRKADVPLEPLLLLTSGARLADLELRDELFDDFCLNPFHPASSSPAFATCSGGPARAVALNWSNTPASS